MIEDATVKKTEKNESFQIFPKLSFGDKRDWFFEKRFGLFLHWGIYSVGGLQEQELQRYGRTYEVYDRYISQFKAKKFDPDKWIDYAEAAGMRYLVFTSKHHDGFCMWDSLSSDYNIMRTPFGRDAVKELAEACHRRNFPLMIYYSCVDWRHEAYPNIGRHHEIVTDPAKHDMTRYLEYVKIQVTELCTRYPTIAGLWWDMNIPELVVPEINELVYRLLPGALVNSRGWSKGDTDTPERDFNPTDPAIRHFEVPTEVCDSIGLSSWGYRCREDYYQADELKRRLTRAMSRGGNYLLNVGPKADGDFPDQAKFLLKTIGTWYHKVKEALHATPCSIGLSKPDFYVTSGNHALYIIVNQPLESTMIDLRPFNRVPAKATLLNTGGEIEFTREPIVYHKALGPALRLINLPQTSDAEPTVIRLDF